MCRKFILSIFVLLFLTEAANATQFAYQVNFTDKQGTLTFSDSLSFLSPRAMARRNNQGILLDSTDLPVTRAYIDSVLVLTGGKLHEVSKWLNLCVILISDSNQIHALNGIAFVSGVKVVGYYSGTLHKDGHKNATHAKTTSGASYYNQTWLQTTVVNGNYLHDIGHKGAGKIIAVVDGGFSNADTHSGFDSLRNSGRLVDVYNFALDTSYVFAYDDHGTEVLSTMAGYVPDTFVGSAPLASYALYVTEAAGERPIELLNLLCGAERADSIGADVISSSLGYNTFDDFDFHYNADFTYADLDGKTTVATIAANMATKKGILFVSSAGNQGSPGDPWHYILTPGDADSVLTIGSVDATGTNASNSGYGPNAAGIIKPDVCGMGESAAVFSPTTYSHASGTSLSTPEIAGFATCLWEASPHSTPGQIRQAIRQCASRYSTPGSQIGYGIPNFQCAAAALNIIDTPIPVDNSLVMATPNPMNDNMILTITLPTSSTVHFKLLDITGRTVLTFSDSFMKGTNTPVSYNVAKLPAGMYLLKATTATLQQTIKLVKS